MSQGREIYLYVEANPENIYGLGEAATVQFLIGSPFKLVVNIIYVSTYRTIKNTNLRRWKFSNCTLTNVSFIVVYENIISLHYCSNTNFKDISSLGPVILHVWNIIGEVWGIHVSNGIIFKRNNILYRHKPRQIVICNSSKKKTPKDNFFSYFPLL